MKPRFLVLLSGIFTLGFGYWLAEESRDAREIWVSMGAWVLGFWFASSILGPPRPDSESIDSEADQGDEFEEYDEDDEFDDEDREE
jgi:hypothetical protein